MPTVLDKSEAVKHPKKIMVVDNDSIVRRYMAKIFDTAGLQVETASDGVTALDLLETYTPDLIFIDLVMPNIDGQTLCHILRCRPRYANTPIVIISAIAAEEATDIVKVGADICIAKSGFADMKTMINRILDDPTLLSDPNLKNRVLGIEDLAPRTITSELLAINRHFRTMLDSISNGIMTINQNNRIIYANPAALHFFSMGIEMMLGKHLSRIFSGAMREQVLSLLEEISSADSTPVKNITVTANNRILGLCFVPTDADKNSKVVILEDITERESTRKALIKANHRLQLQAMIDGLTNVSNRRHFDELLLREWGRMRREKGQLSMILCDVDYFKDFNDTYGHLAGDQCLRDIAESIKSILQRPSDNVARYGGDEFVILLPGTSFKGACQLAEQIRERIGQLQITHKTSPIADHVTMTLGASSGYPSDDVLKDRFIWLADKALYEAKTKGRNCSIGKKWPLP